MNLFQLVVLPTILVIASLDLRSLILGRISQATWLARLICWVVATVLVFNPAIATRISSSLGIGRGADFVIYVFMLVSPIVWFRTQTQLHSIRSQVVYLARVEAIRGATFGTEESVDEKQAGRT